MKNEKPYVETPLMKQYYELKAQNPDAILLFRVGDFYETFGEDAIFTAKALNIVLTRRANGSASFVELAGFPYHALETYLYKLVKAGKKLAICEQLEDPKLTKKIVKRGVTELITPGVTFSSNLLEAGENNFLAAIYIPKNKIDFGIALLDASTGEFFLSQGDVKYISKILGTFSPSEILVQKSNRLIFSDLFGEDYFLSFLDEWVFQFDFAREALLNQFQTNSLKGFGIDDKSLVNGIISAGVCIYYLSETKHGDSFHINTLKRIPGESNMWLDKCTLQNLELIESKSFIGSSSSLLDVLNFTKTPMGARSLRRDLSMPLLDIEEIRSRHSMVKEAISLMPKFEELDFCLNEIGDLERVISKLALKRIQPKELEQLKISILAFERLKTFELPEIFYDRLFNYLESTDELLSLISRYIVENPSGSVQKGNVICSGISSELDEYREIAYSGKDYLISLQKAKAEKTGISSLKLGFNNVFGYYLEVSNVHKDKVPDDWIRKQTLINCERYITEDLKLYEEKVLVAQDLILNIENQIYTDFLDLIQKFIPSLQKNASLIAYFDLLYSFAKVSIKNNYVMPKMSSNSDILINKARHPIIERMLKPGQAYIANDICLNSENQILMITGPNMSGKSAILRQTALISIMAQIGCFVPAQEAHLGIFDRIFTRVGANDNITTGESTFMLEMNEAANILNNLSSSSLVLLDEIGRGTSTYDGVSIAWAISEFLHQNDIFKPKVLFATHYHELNQMTEFFPRIKNFHIRTKEVKDQIIFLRELLPGGSEHSFGIHVARMAGMPKFVIERASQVLKNLEETRGKESFLLLGDNKNYTKEIIENSKDHRFVGNDAPTSFEIINKKTNPYQLSFIQLDDPLLQEIKEDILACNLDELTPLQALNKLNEIKILLKCEKQVIK